MRAAFSLLSLTLAVAPLRAASAQYYLLNENKVQYRRLDWQVLKGARVDVYYYPDEAALAPVALAYAEETYDVLAPKFGHTVSSRIPLIVYASHSDFEQTNILPFSPPEGLLGVTDYLKRRVTLPFRGNLAEFRHTLRHEMVHAFQISLLYDRYDKSPRSAQVPIPLWWTEGLAELWSGGEDARDEMILRDLVLGGRLPRLQDISYVTGGIVYPLGGRIHRWLADTYGDWRVAGFYRELWRYESFESAIQGTYGRSLGQLNEEFQVAMRRQYYPAVEGRNSLPAVARLVAPAAIKPSFAPDDSTGGKVVYAAGGNGLITIQERPIDGGRPVSLITSGRSTSFENLHAFDSRIDASRQGLLLFSSRFQDRDALIVFDPNRRKVVGRYQFPGLVSILSPIWDPEDGSVIFSGLAESGVSDLYRMRLRDGQLEHLTDDAYQDLDPSLSPDGTRLVFASDRTAGGLEDAVNLFVLDLSTRAIRQVTYGSWVDETPRWVSQDRILFSSSRDGVLNAFSMDSLGNGRRETAVWTGAFDAAPAGDRDALLVGGFHDLSLGVYLYPGDSLARQETFELAEPPAHSQWAWPVGAPGDVAQMKGQPYRRKYALDFATGEFAYVPRVGTGQGATFLISDLLSDNLFYVNFSTFQGRKFQSVFDNISVLGLYLNQSRRLNWGIGLFRFKGNQYEGDFLPSYTENTTGGFGLLRYPLSKFARVEGQFSVEHSDRVDLTLPVADPERVGWIASQYVSYIHDNSLWTSTGPIDGHLLAVSTGVASDFSNARFDSYTTIVDGRQYFRFGRRSALAVRGVGFYSGGDRPQRVNIGGTLGIRGFPNYGYIIGSRAWMFNSEIRYPLLDYFTFGTPLGPIRFPEVQGALFTDVGRAWLFSEERRALIGSAGVSFRWPLVPGLVLRLDWGRRFTDGNFRGYGLNPDQKSRSFVQFFFGYNY
jgi:hypothetical protein